MSGTAVLAALREMGVNAHPFDPSERDLLELKRDGYDRVPSSHCTDAAAKTAACRGRWNACAFPTPAAA
jgi:hypothetical protein